MVDLSYRIEKRLFRSSERCPTCGGHAKRMIEESHMPGRRGISPTVAPHISREYCCASDHRWRAASYDGEHYHPVGARPEPGINFLAQAFGTKVTGPSWDVGRSDPEQSQSLLQRVWKWLCRG